jgi:hypothetical protein
MDCVRRFLLVLSVVGVLLIPSAVANPFDDLVFVAVEPCRVADTRNSPSGEVPAGSHRNFKISGTAEDLARQGGTVDCLHPKLTAGVEPVAVAAYVIAVPGPGSVGAGVLSMYPSDRPIPPPGTGSTVNFTEDSAIGNTTIAKVCHGRCGAGGELAVVARNSRRHVVIDIQGYFYPRTANGACSTLDLVGVWQTFVAESALGASSCQLEVLPDGSIAEGDCASTNGIVQFNWGELAATEDCLVLGSLFIDGVRNLVSLARLSVDRNTITGIIEIEGVSTLFNAVRMDDDYAPR